MKENIALGMMNECVNDLENLAEALVGNSYSILRGMSPLQFSCRQGEVKISFRRIYVSAVGLHNIEKELNDFFIPEYPVDKVFFHVLNSDREYTHFTVLMKDLPMGWDSYYALKDNGDLFNG